MDYDAKVTVNDFATGLGNGKKSLTALGAAIGNIVASSNGGYDGTDIAKMIDRAAKRDDKPAISAVKLVVKAVFGGAVKIAEPKDGKTASVKLRGAELSLENLRVLQRLVADEVSIRSPKLKEAFGAKKAGYDVAALKRAVLKAKSEGYDDDAIMSLVRETLSEG